MASKVNLRFTAILILIIAVVFAATAAVAFIALKNSGEDLVAQGDALMDKGEVEEAIKAYSRAVNKQQMNEEWIRKWVAAMEQYVPESRQEYSQYYMGEYLSGLAGLARADTTGVDSRRRFLEEIYQRYRRLGADQANWEQLVQETEDQMERAGPVEGVDALRRYRGLARQAILDAGGELPEADAQLTLEDLDAALKADPADADAAVAKAAWHATMARRARFSSLPELAAEHRAKAMEAITAFLEANPDSRYARLAKLTLEMDAFRQASQGRITPEAFQERFGPTVDELERMTLAADPKTLDPLVVQRLALQMRVTGRTDRVAGLLERALEGRPTDAGLRLALAQLLTPTDAARAIVELDKVIAQPDQPVGIDGLALLYQRDLAREWKIMAALTQWEQAKDAAAKAEALDRAETFRDDLAAAVRDDNERVLLADARLHFARGELMPARKALNDYLKINAGDDDARLLLANVMQQQGSLGAARDLLSDVVEGGRVSLPVIARLALVCGQLEEYDEAVRYAQMLVDAEPENEAYQGMLRDFQDVLAGGGEDDVKKGLMQAREMLSGVTPDEEGALALLRGLIQSHPEDVRPHSALVEALTFFGDKDEAKKAADDALAAFPDNAALRRFRDALDVENPVQVLLARIEASEQPEVQKRLLSYQLLSRFGRQEEADEQLRLAAEAQPTNPTVVETLFVRALTNEDVPAAEAQAAIAERENLDNAKGQTYRARILMLKGEFKEAASLLERALAADPFNEGAHRWLGELRLKLGQPTAAIDALQHALELRPNDISATKALMRAHAMAGHPEQALRLAREAQDRGASDRDFVEHWLLLETTAPGGDRDEALRIRRSLAERFPDDERNRAQLVRLLMEDQQWDEAKTIIDALRAKEDSLAHLELELRWLARQNRLQETVDLLNAFSESHKEEVAGAKNYLLLADVLLEVGQQDLAAETLRQGRGYQDPKMPRCDLSLAAMLFQMGRFPESLEAYRAARATMDPANDTERLVPKRIVECLLNTGAYEEALKSIDDFSLDLRTDATTMLLAAEAHAALGHQRSVVMDLLNRAIAARTDQAIGYVQRAAYNARFPEMASDVEADLVQALDVQPGSMVARQRLADFYRRQGRWTDAINLFLRAVTQDEANEDLRLAAANLLTERQRRDEAIRLLEDGLVINPKSQRLLLSLGGLCKQAERYTDARRHLATLWDATKSSSAAALLVDALLSGDSPDLAGAARLLGTPELKVDQSALLLACRARLRLAQKRPGDEIRADLAKAVTVLDSSNPRAVSDFLTALSQFHKGDKEILATLAAVQPQGGYRLWMALQVATLLAKQPDMADTAVQELTRLAGTEAAPPLRLAAIRTLGQFQYSRGEYDKALETFLSGLELAAEDGELLNNTAYVLSAHLGDPQRALVYAEQAARVRPSDPNVLDTLGVTYTQLDRLDEAESAFKRAVASAGENSQRVAAYIHLAELYVKRSQPADARRYLDLLGELETSDPGAIAPFAENIRTLRDQVSQG